MNKVLSVTTSFSNREEGLRVAEQLLERRLVACTHLAPAGESLYWWKGNLVREQECVLQMKTLSRLYRQLENSLKELHSYEVPEIVATVLDPVSESYRDWLERELKQD